MLGIRIRKWAYRLLVDFLIRSIQDENELEQMKIIGHMARWGEDINATR